MMRTMPTLTLIAGITVVALLGVALVYAVGRWRRRRKSAGVAAHALRETRTTSPPSQLPVRDDSADLSKDVSATNPKLMGKLRSGREADRPSEDDLAQQHIGWRGLPGERPRSDSLPEKITQIPKPLDPGHTA
jgi:hypothetical protein